MRLYSQLRQGSHTPCFLWIRPVFANSQLVAVVLLSYKKIVILFSRTIHICQVDEFKNNDKLNILVRCHGSL
jgi:hypothetical protein